MENNWEPRVGQKVVCVESPHSNDRWNPVEGETYLITDVDGTGFCQVDDFRWWYDNRRFAPIPEQFKEHPDTVDQPVKVLEVQN